MAEPTGSTAPTPEGRPYSMSRLSGVTALLILILVSATSVMLYVSYEDALREQKTNLRNVSIAFAAQTQSVAQAVSQVMLQVERGYTDKKTADAEQPDLRHFFEDRGPAQEYLLGIHVFDQAGAPQGQFAEAVERAGVGRFVRMYPSVGVRHGLPPICQ